MSNNLDEVLESGTEEEIEAALAEVELSESDFFGGDAEEEANIDEVATPKNDVAEEAKAEPAPESSPAEEAKPSTGIIEQDGKFFVEVSKENAELESKDGKHKLPYDLLVGERGKAAGIKAELEEERRKNAEIQESLDESKRVADLYSKQLGDAGLDPALLPEQMLQDPKLMERIKEDYPEIGDLVSALAQQVQQAAPVEQKPVETQVDASQNPAQEAFNQSSHLKAWQTGDADRWEMAKIIDERLANDPLFENKTPSERFAEVEKRVMSAFGDEPTEKAAPPTSVKAPIPNTPSDLGHQGNDLSPNANILDQDAGTMAASMENMSETAIEALLEDASNFL